jgi:hypothetical protein
MKKLLLTAAALPLLLTAVPAHADVTTGTGVVTGSLQYTTGGVPDPTGLCTPSAWQLSAQTNSAIPGGGAAVVHLVGAEFVGTVNFVINATDSVGACASTEDEFGTIATTSSINGSNPAIGSSLTCSNVSGGFIRAFTHIHIGVTASCTINSNTFASVLIPLEVEMVPTQPPALGTATKSWAVNGPFVFQGS